MGELEQASLFGGAQPPAVAVPAAAPEREEVLPPPKPDTGVALFGHDLFGEPVNQRTNSVLGKRFLLPPFSVLDARQGWWQERKQAWLSLGIQSELGRDAKNTSCTISAGTAPELKERLAGLDGTSVFDPTLCELCYRWWSPVGGLVLDPFAGGSVRGIVAACLGRPYYGIELRAEQVAANRAQAATITPDNPPEWVEGDSRNALPAAPLADFIFSCPPYGDLEVYSATPGDISNMPRREFGLAYADIVLKAAARLKPDRFAAWVVGDFRDKAGHFRGFVGFTVDVFAAAGLKLYNEAVLVTAVGSLPIRVSAQWEGSRKLGKTHQNLLVFVKGDAKRAAAACEGPAGA